MNGKNIANATKLVKKLMQYKLEENMNKCTYQNHIQIEEKKYVELFNDKKLYNRKQIRKLFLIMNVVNLK